MKYRYLLYKLLVEKIYKVMDSQQDLLVAHDKNYKHFHYGIFQAQRKNMGFFYLT
jgi:hypothetical protein